MDNSTKITIPIWLILIIMSVVMSALSGWMIASKAYMDKSLVSHKQLNINDIIKDKIYPTITAKNMRIKQGTDFNVKEHVQARSFNDASQDISNKVEYFGMVDTNKKGVYEIRCVVRDSLGLKTVKTIQIIVD